MKIFTAIFSVLSAALLTTPIQAAQPAIPAGAHAWLEINATAFEDNLKRLTALIGPHVELCPVLKSDAYGNGLALLMPSVIKMHIPCIGITSNEEASIARRRGFTGRVMRLRAARVTEMTEASPLHIEELLGNLELAQSLNSWAAKNHKIISYHLALNSGGMSRNGIDLARAGARDETLRILKLQKLKIVGIMTHFPVEESEDVKKGLAVFNREAQWVIDNGHLDRKKLVLHTANTFTLLHVSEAWLDLVRPGSALFGDTLPDHPEYRPTLSFKSRVASINSYPEGNTVSYDRTSTLKRPSRLANIPVGYGDGYRRSFSNEGHVLIRGKRCPILGRVTMSTIMVDVTDLPDAAAGDEVVLFGQQGSSAITQEELEKQGGTIMVDQFVAWGKANPRVLIRSL